jgi:hypothetical protein
VGAGNFSWPFLRLLARRNDLIRGDRRQRRHPERSVCSQQPRHVTVIDKAAYDREVAHEERLALGVLGAFGVAGATLGAATAAQARSTA